MKKYIFGILFAILAICMIEPATAQSGTVKHIYDTLNGNETVNFSTIQVSGVYNSLALDIECTELGGTSDGTLRVQARNGSNAEWTTLSDYYFNTFKAYPADTTTITDGVVMKVEIEFPSWREYRVQGIGTASDTTLVDIYYVFK
jgi:hypothetical protein